MKKHSTFNIQRRTFKTDVCAGRSMLGETVAKSLGDVQRMWSAATSRRFSAVTTCRHGSTASSGAAHGRSVIASAALLGQSTEPLCAALPERQVAQATKAATSRRTPKNKNQGFTLIEVLLAVGIFAIVLFAINTVFFSALKLERATSQAVDKRAPLNQAFAILRRDLQCAVQPMTNSTLLPRNFITGGRSGGLGSSQANSLEFYTTTGVIGDAEPWSDLQKVRYELVASSDVANAKGQDLVRVITRNVLATTTEEEDEQLLMSDVESVEFLCYNGSDWRNAWDSSAGDVGLPLAVKVRVQLAPENQTTKILREPVELLVPITTVLLTNSLAGGAQ